MFLVVTAALTVIVGCASKSADLVLDSVVATPVTVTDSAGTASTAVTVTVTVTGAAGGAGSGGTASMVTVGGTTSDAGTTSDPAGSAPVAGASEWVNVTGSLAGQVSECGNLMSLSVRPDKDVLIAGVAAAGLWANVDGSTTDWVALGSGSAPISGRPTSYTYDPDHPDTWWVSAIYGDGVYRTTDGGTTFDRLGGVINVDYVSVDLTDPARSTLLAGIHELTEVDRSTDGGATWSPIAVLPADVGYTTAPYVVNATTYLLGTTNGSKSGIYRTTDSGTSWTLVQPGGVSGQPLVASDGGMYWVINGGTLVRSTDQGATWATMSRQLSLGSLVELADGRIGAVVADSIGTSSDHGATWTQVGPRLPYVANGMTYSAMRNAFYVWRWDCDFSRPDPVLPDAIMRIEGAAAPG